MWWPKMRNHKANSVIIALIVKRTKNDMGKYGHLPKKESEAKPYDKLCIDLIGPYTIRQKGKKYPLICKCVTKTDPATGWFEICQFGDKQSITVANIMEQE